MEIRTLQAMQTFGIMCTARAPVAQPDRAMVS